MSTPSPLTIKPNPVPAGKEVEIEFDGTPPLFVRTHGEGEWTEVPIDPKTGRGKVRVPTGRLLLLFMDSSKPENSTEVDIVDPTRSAPA